MAAAEGTLAEVCGTPGGHRLRAEATDGGDGLPHRRRPGEPASSGRGLMLIEVLADAWGVEPRGEGKSIWFELYEPDGSGPRDSAGPDVP